MSKRRTKKQKSQARHQFKISWKPLEKTGEFEPEKEVFKAGVKGQFPSAKTQDEQKATKKELAKISAENKNLGTIKHDLSRSLLLASFIFSLEVVLYLFWQ